MAKSTSIELRRKVVYSIFIRNHTMEGTIAAIEPDLERIKALGTDIILLMPFYLEGGSPYTVKDSRAVSPEYGQMADLQRLIDHIHALDMLVIIEVVFNHISHNSLLLSERPDWFYTDREGNNISRTLNKPDVFDFNYDNPAVWDYHIETLLIWAKYVDGFCCNLAPLIPLDFWIKARDTIENIKQGLIWIADTLEPWLIVEHRAHGFTAHSDSEIYQAFDICFDNQIKRPFYAYLRGDVKLSDYIINIENQEAWYPDNYCKLRFLENYSTQRIKSLISSNIVLRSWTAFLYLLKGAVMIFAGQEHSCTITPCLTGKDPIDWDSGPDLSGLIRNLYKIKKNPIFSQGVFYITANDRTDTATIRYVMGDKWLEGSFSLKGQSGLIDTFVSDGHYLNMLDYSVVNVKHGKYGVDQNPVIFCSEFKS